MRLGGSRTPEGMRLYAIGDVHGCDAMLAEAHEKIAADLSATCRRRRGAGASRCGRGSRATRASINSARNW